MAVFRVEKTRDYTVMSNHHLKNKELTLKAKGLMSLILSLPDNWDYTTRGLAAICKENKDTIGKIVNELILAGYIVRHQERGEGGKMGSCVYTIYENPQESGIKPRPKKPDTANPDTGKPVTEKPSPVFSDKLNTNIKNIKKLNTDVINSSLISSSLTDNSVERNFEIARKEKIRSDLKQQIDFEYLKEDYPNVGLIDDVFEIMAEILTSVREYWKIGGENVPTWELQERVKSIDSEQVELIVDSYLKQGVEVKKPKAYLVKCLYNGYTIKNAYWDNQVRASGAVSPDGLYKKI